MESLLRSFSSTSLNCNIFSLNKSSHTYNFITIIPCSISDIFEILWSVHLEMSLEFSEIFFPIYSCSGVISNTLVIEPIIALIPNFVYTKYNIIVT